MAIDVRKFSQVNAIDTCAIWNLLSSATLLAATLGRQRWFVVADFVRYEALERPRSTPDAKELALQSIFRKRLENSQGFHRQSVDLADLQAVAGMPAIARLGGGEIATLALARKMRIGFMTDDQKARKKADEVVPGPAHTTPHLLGWLIYEGALSDGDFSTVVREHEAYVSKKKGQLTKFFHEVYLEACRCRLMSKHTTS